MNKSIEAYRQEGKMGARVLSMAGMLLAALVVSLVLAAPAQALSVGDTFTVSGNKYKVTDIDYDPGDMSEVMLVKYGSSSKAPKVNTVKYKDQTFEVDAIGKNAFNNAKGHKVTSVTIGRHVDKIMSKAFYGCKKLSVVNMRNADVIDIDWERGRYVLDDLDIARNAFSKAGASSVKVKCGVANSQYKSVFKKALESAGMRSGVRVVK